MVVGNENYDFHEMEKVGFIVDDCVVCENISFIPYILAYQIQKSIVLPWLRNLYPITKMIAKLFPLHG